MKCATFREKYYKLIEIVKNIVPKIHAVATLIFITSLLLLTERSIFIMRSILKVITFGLAFYFLAYALVKNIKEIIGGGKNE